MGTIAQIKKEFFEMKKIPVFEFDTTHIATEGPEVVSFWISLRGRTLYAESVELTKAEVNKGKARVIRVLIDRDFSLDENLQALHEKCITALLESDLFKLN